MEREFDLFQFRNEYEKISVFNFCQKYFWFNLVIRKYIHILLSWFIMTQKKMDIKTQKILAYSLDENLTPSELRKTDDFSDFFENVDNQYSAEKLETWMNQHNIIWLLDDDAEFPHQFTSIKNPPAILYAMWNLEILNHQILWIVWPRDMSQYANQVMQALFTQIWNSNIVTVSWMARGVDHLCHQLSIGYHLPTIAILGWGLRYYRNSSARSFMEQIIQNGWLILSEFKLDFKPTPRSFPQRNRLIAGLSDALFLPEAREWSWSLITADYAYQFHKPIFVVPNPIFSENWIWSNHLVTSWKANLLSDFSQILKLFDIEHIKWDNENDCQYSAAMNQNSFTDEQKSLLNIVSQHKNQDFSEWITEISTDLWEAMCKLTDLEMMWYISQAAPWNYFVKVKFN